MRVVVTKQALKRLNDVMDYLILKAGEAIAERTNQDTWHHIDQLEMHPEIGQLEPYLDHLPIKYRRVVVGNYKVIYHIEPDVLFIDDIFDTHQHPSKMNVGPASSKDIS